MVSFRGRFAIVATSACALLLASCHDGQGRRAATLSPSDRRLLDAGQDPANWLTHGGTYLEQRFSPLDKINAGNVGGLKLAWYYDLDTNRGQEATPLVIDGVLYTSTAWSKVKAVDAATGRELWQYDPNVPGEWGEKGCCDVVSRGLAWYDGKLYLATFDGRLVALDARTGQPVWTVQTTDHAHSYTITGAPRVVHGKVIIGNAGAELGVRGYVTAYDAETGTKVWRFYTIPGDPSKGPDNEVSDKVLGEKARGTWFGNWYKYGGGGTVWDAIVYDPDLNQLYLGVGNGSPWNQQIRSDGKGDNLFLSSIVALDPDTGEYKWHFQETPGETWDFTATQPIMLATLKIDGRDRKVLMQAPKSGYFYVLDRETGKLISAKNFVPVNWSTGIDPETSRPIEVPAARYKTGPFVVLPSANGAHNWYPTAFSPKTGLVYIPAQEVPYAYQAVNDFKFRPGTWNLGVFSALNAVPDDEAKLKAIRATLKGELIAWDPVHQREVWRHQYAGPGNGGALATGGNLVFQGDIDNAVHAFDAMSGKMLWTFPTQNSAMAAPITYTVNGEQYVAIVVGAGGGYGLSSPFFDDKRPKPNGRILAFKIGGTAQLPTWNPPVQSPANPPKQSFTAQQVAMGQQVFEGTCGYCHGAGAISTGVLPDLRRSRALSDKEVWDSIILGGVLKDGGMISFAPWLTSEQVEDVRAFVAHRATLLARKESKSAPQ